MLRLGFACHWDPVRERTWSGTPWRLREALNGDPTIDVVDVAPTIAGPVRRGLRLAGARISDGRVRSHWRHSAAAVNLIEADLERRVRRAAPDVVLQIQDLGVLPTPFLVYQDLSFAILAERFGPEGVPHFRTLGRRRVDALRRRQETLYEHAAMLLPMSDWLASSLRRGGVAPQRLAVVNPGVNVRLDSGRAIPERRRGPVRRLLLIGRDFDTKGGTQVVAAFRTLRAEMGPSISLTIAGPATWPLRGEVPDGVTFLGPVPATRVAELLDTHDLFVMPSLFEGFGIAFVEALVRGLPCIGRDDCAMPEIIDKSSGGRLVTSESSDELAALIVSALDDDDLYTACADAAPARREHYAWPRAAGEIRVAAQAVAA